MEKIGLLAGVGRLPVECARAAKAMGYEVYAVGLIPGVEPELKECTADYTDISVAHLQAIIDYLKSKGVKFIEESKNIDQNGNYAAVYLDGDINGFAVHLLQK